MENNRLIAHFMGWKSNRYENLPNRLHKDVKYGEIAMSLSECFYDTDWNQLMAVINKIESLLLVINIYKDECDICWLGAEPDDKSWLEKIKTFKDIYVEGDNKISATYNAVVQFITWYNMQ